MTNRVDPECKRIVFTVCHRHARLIDTTQMFHGCVNSQSSSFYNKDASFCSSMNDGFDSEDEQEKTEGTV